MVLSLSRSSDSVVILMVAVDVSLMYLRCFLSSRSHISLRGTLRAFIKTSSWDTLPFLVHTLSIYRVSILGSLSIAATGGLAGIDTLHPGSLFF